MTVLKIVDHLRKKSPAHAALVRALDGPGPAGTEITSVSAADFIMSSLWGDGFMIVPRDDKEG